MNAKKIGTITFAILINIFFCSILLSIHIMKTLTAWIATIGTNPYFIAFMAHSMTAYALMLTFRTAWLALPIIALASCKEFIFDAHNETPKQTAHDNWLDLAGYVAGALLGVAYLIIF